MITTREPEDWRDLQSSVAEILGACGFAVEIEKDVPVARGAVEVDVYAEEMVKGRKYVIICECKHWKSRVPQNVLHAFRTVIAEAGANLGYVVSSAGFQTGAFAAAELTNIRLRTWREFQQEFEESWLDQYLFPFVTEHFDALMTYTEPLLPTAFGKLTEAKQREFLELKRRYDIFGVLLMTFTTYARMIVKHPVPELPLRKQLNVNVEGANLIPSELLDALGYKEFLDAAIAYGDNATEEFKKVLESEGLHI